MAFLLLSAAALHQRSGIYSIRRESLTASCHKHSAVQHPSPSTFFDPSRHHGQRPKVLRKKKNSATSKDSFQSQLLWAQKSNHGHKQHKCSPALSNRLNRKPIRSPTGHHERVSRNLIRHKSVSGWAGILMLRLPSHDKKFLLYIGISSSQQSCPHTTHLQDNPSGMGVE